MTTLVTNQPQGNASSFRGRNFRKAPTASLTGCVWKRPGAKYPGWTRPRSNEDFVEFVDLTDPDTAREYLVAREILELVDYGAAEHCVQVARDRTSDRTGSAKADGSQVQSENDRESEASDLPFLQDLFPQTDRESQGSACPSLKITTVHPGASQDNPIVLDDEQLVDKHGPAMPNDGKPIFNVADPVDFCGPSLTLSVVLAEPDTDNGEDARNGLIDHNTDGCGNGEEARSENTHEDEIPHNDTLVCAEDDGKGGNDDTGLDAPASASLIYDDERTFGMTRRKQKAERSTLHDSQDSDLTVGSISQPISREEPRAVANNSVTSVGQPTERADTDADPNNFSGALENLSIYRRRQSNRGTQTDGVLSERLTTFSGDCRQERTLTRYSLSPPRMSVDEATRSEPSALIQGARTGKQTRSSVAPETLPDNGATRKRPRRAPKGTWKARDEGDSGASGNGIGADVPVSNGLIPNILVEHEKTTSIPRRTQSAACSASHNLQNCNLSVGAIPRYTQGVQSRKRSRSSTGPATPSANGAVRKRPCRAIKETRKAREAREELQSKRSQTLLN